MWLVVTVAAEASTWQDMSTVVVAAVALLSAIGAAFVAAKGTFRTADTTREVAHNQRVDAELERLRTRLDTAVTERDRYRELYVQLRIGVRERGLNPDDLTGTGSTDASSQSP